MYSLLLLACAPGTPPAAGGEPVELPVTLEPLRPDQGFRDPVSLRGDLELVTVDVTHEFGISGVRLRPISAWPASVHVDFHGFSMLEGLEVEVAETGERLEVRAAPSPEPGVDFRAAFVPKGQQITVFWVDAYR